MKFTPVTQYGKIGRSFCSNECRKKGTAEGKIALGMLWIIISIILILLTGGKNQWNFGEYLASLIFVLPGFVMFMTGKEDAKLDIVPHSRRKQSVLNSTRPDIPGTWDKFKFINGELQRKTPSKSNSPLHRNEQPINVESTKTSGSIKDHVPKIHVKELNKEFLSCCYQTARYGGDSYCVCGRAIPKDLRQVFN